MVASRSTPGLSQKVSSSVAVVASSTTLGMRSKSSMTERRSSQNSARRTPSREYMTDCSLKSRSWKERTSGRPSSRVARAMVAAPPTVMAAAEATLTPETSRMSSMTSTALGPDEAFLRRMLRVTARRAA